MRRDDSERVSRVRDVCNDRGYPCRGNLHDVACREFVAAQQGNAEVVFTGVGDDVGKHVTERLQAVEEGVCHLFEYDDVGGGLADVGEDVIVGRVCSIDIEQEQTAGRWLRVQLMKRGHIQRDKSGDVQEEERRQHCGGDSTFEAEKGWHETCAHDRILNPEMGRQIERPPEAGQECERRCRATGCTGSLEEAGHRYTSSANCGRRTGSSGRVSCVGAFHGFEGVCHIWGSTLASC